MTKILMFAVLVVFSSTKACSTKNREVSSNESKVIANGELKLDAALKLSEGAPLQITKAQIIGDSLFAEVQYSGGCKEANFSLVWNGMIAKSMPPQVSVWIYRTPFDSCEALISNRLTFDISSLKEVNSKVIVKLNGWNERLTYESAK